MKTNTLLTPQKEQTHCFGNKTLKNEKSITVDRTMLFQFCHPVKTFYKNQVSLVVRQKCTECTNSRQFFLSRTLVPRAAQTQTNQHILQQVSARVQPCAQNTGVFFTVQMKIHFQTILPCNMKRKATDLPIKLFAAV